MRFLSKLSSAISQKVGSLDGKSVSKSAKTCTFFFLFYYKNRNICQFHALTIINNYGNMSENVEFRFENSLRRMKRYKMINKLTKINRQVWRRY